MLVISSSSSIAAVVSDDAIAKLEEYIINNPDKKAKIATVMENGIKKSLKNMVKELPTILDSKTTLTSVGYKDKVITYTAEYDWEGIPVSVLKHNLKETTAAQDAAYTFICTTPVSKLVVDHLNITYEYLYYDKDSGEYVGQIIIDSCSDKPATNVNSYSNASGEAKF